MASVNKVILIGNLGKEPEVRVMQNGKSVANITIATSESWKDSGSGEKKERTEWHNIIFYGPLAEIVAKYLHKGSSVFIEGKLQTRKWTDKNGVERYTTEIVASDMTMLGGKQQGGSSPAPTNTRPAQNSEPATTNASGFDDDMPF